MGAFVKAVLPQPNIDSVKEELDYLLDNRAEGKYSKEEIDECHRVLAEYWQAKTEKRRIDIPNLEKLKPELQMVLLKDMLTNGNYHTEGLLKFRDKIRLEEASKKGNADGLVEYRVNGLRHVLTQMEEKHIKDYILDVVFGKSGLSNYGVRIDDLIKKYMLFGGNRSLKGNCLFKSCT